MKNLKKQLAAATAVAALAAVPVAAGAPPAQQPGANVGFVLSVSLAKERSSRLTPAQRRIARNPALMTAIGYFIGSRQDGLLGGIVGAV